MAISTAKNAINVAIELLATKVDRDVRSDDALKYTQAALNLAHVLQVLAQTKRTEDGA